MGRLYWAKASYLNFGDDLNLWLWPRLFPGFFVDESDDTLVGIGTILSSKLPRSERLFIMGSGAGYAALPLAEDRRNLVPIFVRGPLTARVLGLPPETAITDGAFLASRFVKRPTGSASGAIFIPHWKSDVLGDWSVVCGYAGLRYVSPMQTVEIVMNAIMEAELVVTESMHGAILADALRVPWVAARASPEINDFKWIDWCLTTGVRHNPVFIPPTGNYHLYRQNKVRALGSEETFSVEHNADEAQLADAFFRRFPSQTTGDSSASPGRIFQLSRLLDLEREKFIRWAMRQAMLKPSISVRDIDHKERAAIALAAASVSAPTLSDDAVHSRLMDKLDGAVDTFRAATAL